MAVRKQKWLAYTLWLFGGIFGCHQFYLGRDLHAFTMWCTLGGGLGLGWLRDLWRIPEYVADANEDEKYLKKLVEKMQKHSKPPFSTARFLGQIVLSYFLGLTFYWSIPYPEDVPNGWNILLLRFLTPIPISLGVWVVGNIGREQGLMKPALVSAATNYVLSYSNMPGNIIWCCFFASLGFTFKSKEWRRTPKPPRGLLRRTVVVVGSCLIYLAFVGSGLYFNCEINNEKGEKVKLRDSVDTFMKSPYWVELKEQLIRAYNYYRAYGWRKLYENFLEQLDPSGESGALKTLGLKDTATKPEIVARFRSLSKEWHPDRHQDEAKKREAHIKFMEYQDAYQRLIKIRGKIKAATPLNAEQMNQ